MIEDETIDDYPCLQSLLASVEKVIPIENQADVAEAIVAWWNSNILELTYEATFEDFVHDSENDWQKTLRMAVRDMFESDNLKRLLRILRFVTEDPAVRRLKISTFFVTPPGGYEQDIRL
jgi:hypothetical protein